MNKVKRLFWLASFFEKKATALKSSGVKILTDYQSFRFKELVELLTNIIPSQENINSWVLKNKSVIDYNPNVFESLWVKNDKNLVSAYFNVSLKLKYYLSTDSKLSDDIDVEKSYYLKSDGAIPDLFLFIGADASKTFKVTKEMAHEKWLLEALSKLFESNIDDIFLKDAQQFIIENKAKINEFRRHFTGNPSVMGTGADGVVLVLNPSLVLKLFRSRFAYNAALQAIERLHKNTPGAKTEAMIYDAGTLGEFWNTNIFYYLIEKMIPFDKLSLNLPGPIQDKLEETIYYLRREISKLDLTKLQTLFQDTKNPDIFDYEFKFYVSKMEILFKNNFEHDYLDIQDFIKMKPDSLPLKDSWLSSLIEEILMKYLTDRTDLHTGNIGVTGYGELRYFDPAYK